MTKFFNISTDNTLGGNAPSDELVVSQKAIKEYVDNQAGGGGYQPDLFTWQWADHKLNDVQWLRADTFSWQSGAVYQAAYQHLVDDIPTVPTITLENDDVYIRYADGDVAGAHHPYCWKLDNYTAYTNSETPSIDDWTFATATSFLENARVTATGTSMPLPETETIAGVTISFYTATDGHKICLADQESNVAAIYAATGVAWYYIIDTTNQQFKLPRAKHNKYTQSLSVVGTGKVLGLTNGTDTFALNSGATYARLTIGYNAGQNVANSGGYDAGYNVNWKIGVSKDPTYSGLTTTSIEQDTDQYKYLYFYVGNFTQTALENTAGITAETLNDKLDLDLGNATSAAKSTIVGLLLPDYENAVQYTNNAPATYTTTEPCWICCKGANLAYNMTIGNTTIAEFLYSASYTSSWVFCPAGCTLTRIASSQYNNFIVVPLKG